MEEEGEVEVDEPVDDGDQRHVVVWTDPGALGMLHGVAEHGDVHLVLLKPNTRKSSFNIL